MKTASILSNIEIAKPCRADWESMSGDERVRACQLCHLNVYNISSMTKVEAESFLRQELPDGKVCVRLFRRADGTIITDNCPRGLRAARDAMRKAANRVAAIASLFFAVTASISGVHAQSKNTAGDSALMGRVKSVSVQTAQAMMGEAVPIGISIPPFPASKFDGEAYKKELEKQLAHAFVMPKGLHEKISVAFVVKADGSLNELKLLESSGITKLDEKALAAIRAGAPFQPMVSKNSKPVKIQLTFHD